MNKPKIMIVDDSQVMIRTLKTGLESAGYEVVASARTGSDAIQAFKDNKPAVVTMDITLPDMSGIEITKKLIEIDPKVFVIMVTSHEQKQMVINSMQSGAKGYVVKPIKIEELIKVIENNDSNT